MAARERSQAPTPFSTDPSLSLQSRSVSSSFLPLPNVADSIALTEADWQAVHANDDPVFSPQTHHGPLSTLLHQLESNHQKTSSPTAKTPLPSKAITMEMLADNAMLRQKSVEIIRQLCALYRQAAHQFPTIVSIDRQVTETESASMSMDKRLIYYEGLNAAQVTAKELALALMDLTATVRWIMDTATQHYSSLELKLNQAEHVGKRLEEKLEEATYRARQEQEQLSTRLRTKEEELKQQKDYFVKRLEEESKRGAMQLEELNREFQERSSQLFQVTDTLRRENKEKQELLQLENSYRRQLEDIEKERDRMAMEQVHLREELRTSRVEQRIGQTSYDLAIEDVKKLIHTVREWQQDVKLSSDESAPVLNPYSIPNDLSLWTKELFRQLEVLNNYYQDKVGSIAQWRRKLAMVQAEREAEVITLQEKLLPSLAMNEEIMAKNQDLEDQCKRLKRDIQSKDELIKKLRENYAEKRKLLTECREELAHSKQVVESATAQLDRKMRGKYDQAKAAESLTNSDRQKLEEKIDSLLMNVNRQEQLIKDLKKKSRVLEDWKNLRQDDCLENTQLKDQILGMKKELQEKQTYTKQLRETCKSVQNTLEKQQQQSRDMESNFQRELQRVQDQNKRLAAENSRLRKDIKDLHQKQKDWEKLKEQEEINQILKNRQAEESLRSFAQQLRTESPVPELPKPSSNDKAEQICRDILNISLVEIL